MKNFIVVEISVVESVPFNGDFYKSLPKVFKISQAKQLS
jgi:hypothetical protein